MPTYEIICEEKWIVTYRVKADSLGEAISKVEAADPTVEERTSEQADQAVLEGKVVSR